MEVYLGLGANLGDPARQMRQALRALGHGPEVTVEAVSSLYRTEPQGGPAQPDFYNAAAKLLTELPPTVLLRRGLELERLAGRTRGKRNGPRVLDLDWLLYGELVLATRELKLPHPRLAERAFVLVPLAEIAPQVRHPLLGLTVVELARRVGRAGIKQLVQGPDWVRV